MTNTFALHQLYIIRNQVELVIASLEANATVPPLPAEEGPPACEHPVEKRRDMTTMGTEPSYKCLACGETVKGVL